MGWSVNADTDRCFRTTTVPGITGQWWHGGWIRPTTLAASTNYPRWSLAAGAGDAAPYYYAVPYVDSGGNAGLKADYDFNNGSGFQSMSTSFEDLFNTDTDYYLVDRYDGTNIRMYTGTTPTLELTSASGTYTGSPARIDFGYNAIDAVAFRGVLAGHKHFTADIGASGAVVLAESQYRNPQTSPGSCWEAWHAKSGTLSTGNLNGRNIDTLTSIDFAADPAGILGDDPEGGGLPAGEDGLLYLPSTVRAAGPRLW